MPISRPMAASHYDMDNPDPVLSTIEDWRIGSGTAGKDLAKPFTNASFRRYRGLGTRLHGAVADLLAAEHAGTGQQTEGRTGKAMKNWWPFLFY